MKLYHLFTCIAIGLVCWTGSTTKVQAQSGDQILDGIGETGLIARYIFDGNLQDWSRNNLHAEMHGKGATFVQDDQFGKVLSLPGEDEAYITIPGNALEGVESLSVVGWVYLRSDRPDQRFFDFGKEKKTHFFASPVGTKAEEGFQARLLDGANYGPGPVSPAVNTGQWVHLAVVVNVPSQSLSTYLNGKLVGQEDVDLDLEEFNDNSKGPNKLYIGKSRIAGAPYLHAKLHDFRIYRIPLNPGQVANIYNNTPGNDQKYVRVRESHESERTETIVNEPVLYASLLKSVPDISVETVVGHLPRLPRDVKGIYKENFEGPKVRVLWPAPTDNRAVLTPGKYTVTGKVPGTDFRPKATITVKAVDEASTPDRNLQSFALDQVRLLPDMQGNDTKFIENRDKFITTLATTDPDSFLYMFRNAFGQQQPEGVTPLGVWDSQETKLRGHATGHYLTAIAQAYASTGYNDELRSNFAGKMEYMINTLYELSQLSGNPRKGGGDYVSDPTAVPVGPGNEGYNSDLSKEGIRTDYWNWGEGFISAYPPDQFIMLEKGASYGGDDSQVWAPYYTLHKILAGLMDIYEVSGNEKALEIARGMSDWVYARLSQLPTETLISMWNSYIAGEYGGMNEAMARLYRITNEPDYLEAARLFDNIEVFFGDAAHSHGLAMNVDTFRGLHANQHVPQIVGALEMYRGTNAPEYYRIADNFWYKATNDYMYSIGGVAGATNPANAECFTCEPATLYEHGFAPGGQNETCATYNMLKLTRNLFLFDQQAARMDYYERGLYNHILASVAENSPANTYHVPLNPGSVKRFGNADMTGFTCCNGTALESHTKLHNSIYFKGADNQSLYVNLYVPSELQWTERDIQVKQETSFPYDDKTKLTVNGDGNFDLKVRVPKWATEGFFVKINGKSQKVNALPGSYLTLSREWEDGDTVELEMPFHFYLDPVMDQPNIASLFYGPVLLAAQEPGPRTEWRAVNFDPRNIGKSIEGDPKKLEFTIDGIVYKPFFDTYGRHSVYLDVNPLEKK